MTRALNDIADRLERGQCTPEMLRAMAMPQAAAEYQKKFGLPVLPVYGGDTTCVEVTTSEGNVILFDMGTGLRDFSRNATSPQQSQRTHVLHVFSKASHEHLDHRNGLPFASFCFQKKDLYTVHLLRNPAGADGAWMMPLTASFSHGA